jgi:hypothetical protein
MSIDYYSQKLLAVSDVYYLLNSFSIKLKYRNFS